MLGWFAGALLVAGLTAGGALAAEPPSPPMDATLRGSDGKEVTLSRWRGKPVILFYEDRHSTTLNSAFKQALFERGRALGLLEAARVVAVANLEGFDFFPAKQIALSYVRDEERRWGIPILVDLAGTLGERPWRLPTKTSSVVLLDGEGRVVYRHCGRLDAPERELFFQALGGLLGQELPAPAAP